jgi:tetratricopeptide (TPR) repeat protein
LNVAVLLEGSVRKQGNRARISVQLVKTADGFQLWSESYERDMSDILAMQDEISSAVIAALKLRLLDGKAAPSWKRANVEAYDAYLQGRYFYGRRNKSELQKAIAYFEQAIKLDPRYAPAWAELARCRAGQADRGYVPEQEGYRQAQQAVDRALALDKNLAEAYAVLGLIRNHDWDWTGADAAYRRAFQLAPGDATIIGGVADSAWTLGRMDDAISLYRRATEIEPQDNNLYYNLGLVLDSAGRWEEATQALTRALELAPEMEGPHFTLCRIYLGQSRAQDALAEAGKEKHPVFRLLGSTLAYYALGRRTESDANLAELIAKFGTDDPYQIADAYAGRGETDQAFEWLDRAWSQRDSGLVEAKVDPLLSSLKKDPRYAALLTKMRLPL